MPSRFQPQNATLYYPLWIAKWLIHLIVWKLITDVNTPVNIPVNNPVNSWVESGWVQFHYHRHQLWGKLWGFKSWALPSLIFQTVRHSSETSSNLTLDQQLSQLIHPTQINITYAALYMSLLPSFLRNNNIFTCSLMLQASPIFYNGNFLKYINWLKSCIADAN